MRLIIQESLTFKEVLSALESRLLLHSLEWVSFLLVFIIVLVLVLQIRTWKLPNCSIVGVIIPRWTSIAKGDAINISSKEMRIGVLSTLATSRRAWHLFLSLWVSTHGALVPNWWRWVPVDTHSLRALGSTSLVVTDALVFQFVHQTFHLMSFQALWVEIICFWHVQMRNYIFVCFIFEHILVKNDVMEVLVIFFVFKMVHNR